jgi:hypothetical protein
MSCSCCDAGFPTDGTGAGDGKVFVDGMDTTKNFLIPKIVAGSNITLTILNVGGNEQLQIASTGAGPGNSLAQTLAVGNITGGHNIMISSGDSIRGVAGAGAAGSAVPILGGTGAATFAGGAVSMTGGTGNTTGAGGAASVTGGTGGATGVGGVASLTGGAGGATSGNAGKVHIQGGTPSAGNGGAVEIIGSAGVGVNKDGGTVTIQPGAKTGAGTDGSVTINDSAAAAKIQINTTGIGFFATAPVAQQAIAGSRQNNPALTDFLTKLALTGLITDGTIAGTDPATSSTWAVVLANGNLSGGTNPTLTAGDSLLGQAGAGVGGAAPIAGAAGAATFAGGAASLTGGAGGTSGTGGASSVAGGVGGTTGVGGAASLTGGAGGSVSGDAGGISIAGGVPVDGV